MCVCCVVVLVFMRDGERREEMEREREKERTQPARDDPPVEDELSQ